MVSSFPFSRNDIIIEIFKGDSEGVPHLFDTADPFLQFLTDKSDSGNDPVLYRIIDPFLGKGYLLDDRGLDIYRSFDGKHECQDIADRISRDMSFPIDARQVQYLAEVIDKRDLLDGLIWRERRQEIEIQLRRDGIPKGHGFLPRPPVERTDLPLEFFPGSDFQCLECGECCLYYEIVPVSQEEKAWIEEKPWTQLFPDMADKQIIQSLEIQRGAKRRLPSIGRHDGICVFLDNKRCRIHDAYGYEKKPVTCQSFPWSYVQTPKSILVEQGAGCLNHYRDFSPPSTEPQADHRKLYTALLGTKLVLEIGNRVPLHSVGRVTVDISFDEYDEIEKRLIDSVSTAENALSAIHAVLDLFCSFLESQFIVVLGIHESYVKRRRQVLLGNDREPDSMGREEANLYYTLKSVFSPEDHVSSSKLFQAEYVDFYWHIDRRRLRAISGASYEAVIYPKDLPEIVARRVDEPFPLDIFKRYLQRKIFEKYPFDFVSISRGLFALLLHITLLLDYYQARMLKMKEPRNAEELLGFLMWFFEHLFKRKEVKSWQNSIIQHSDLPEVLDTMLTRMQL